MNRSLIVGGIITLVSLICIMVIWPFATNESGYAHHIRTVSGKESIRFEPGFYFKGFFSKITAWPDVVTIQLERESEKKDDISHFSDPTTCQFSDGTYAEFGFTVKWKLPTKEEDMIKIHKDYRTPKRLAQSLADYSKECIQYSSQLMDSERHNSGGKSELRDHFQFQLRNGQYILEQDEVVVMDSLGEIIKRTYENTPKLNNQGTPVLSLSDVQAYNIAPNFVAITYVNYEQLVDDKLKAKVEQSTRESISKQALMTAQQEALTAKAEGDKQIALTRAREEAAKIEAVIQAQKATAVAKEQAAQAKFVAEKIKAEKWAQAEANRALVAAGLTPEQRMNMEIQIADKVSANLAKLQFPQMMIIGGDGKGGQLNPFDAIGLKSFMEIQKQISTKK